MTLCLLICNQVYVFSFIKLYRRRLKVLWFRISFVSTNINRIKKCFHQLHSLKSALPLWNSVVGIATCYELDGPGIESRWGEIFRSRPNRPWGPPSLLYNGYRVCFSGVKRPGRGVEHPPPSSARVKERVELCLYSPSGPSWPVLGRTLPLSYYLFTPASLSSFETLVKVRVHHLTDTKRTEFFQINSSLNL
jgi:hypothetical protein